jgi:5-methylthioadenosine/S-adenosylhomocysteine deaminase
MPTTPIDPLNSSPYALAGRVVTMDAAYSILDQGAIYIDAGRIVAIQPSGMAPPAAYEDAPVIETEGTIYPGLIELHNHLRYNFLRTWDIPQRYTNRKQWIGTPEYRKRISGPIEVLGRTPEYMEAIIRFVESKSLISGVTTTQGIPLYQKDGSFTYYQGIVRYAEKSGEADLPDAVSHLADVEAVDDAAFLARLQQCTCMLLHLSEGTDDLAHSHFTALHMPGDTWAITPALAGIHSLALTQTDFQTLQAHGGAMVWSPLSNMLLYGNTADVKAAKASGVRIALGADWSPSGSKNLLGELKVAHIYSIAHDNLFSDRELVSMVTTTAAQILQWDKALGSIETGKHADLLVIADDDDEPYGSLLHAHESDIALVVINGVPRYGDIDLMTNFGPGTENWLLGEETRTFNLAQTTPDPLIGNLSLADAYDRLREGLQQLPALASNLEQPSAHAEALSPQWSLTVDETAMRPFLNQGMPGLQAARQLSSPTGDVPLSQTLEPLELDALSVIDDPSFLERLNEQVNLPDYIKQGLYDSDLY